MSRNVSRHIASAWLAVLLVSTIGCARTQEPAVTPPTSPDEGWVFQGRDEENTSYSPLAEINDGNVDRLGIAWVVDLPTGDGSVGTPLVEDGVAYQSASFSQVVANDLRDGRVLWTYRPELQWNGEPDRHWGIANRGVALLDGKVFVSAGDCRLRALDKGTGKLVWTADVCTDSAHLTLNAMPHVGHGMVFVGTSNADYGTSRCHVSAFDAATGRRLWRFYTSPGDPAEDSQSADPKALESARATWGKGYTPVGVCPWNSMTYDPKLDLLFVGTGGPSPFPRAQRGERPGDELYSNSILALRPESGRLVWHYQVTPEDIVNYEAVQTLTVADLPIGGESARVLIQAAKNGYFFVLDAESGRLLSADNFVPVNWSSGVDPATGRLKWRPETRYWDNPEHRFRFRPSGLGAHNFQPMSYSVQTRLAYIPAIQLDHDYIFEPSAGGYGGVKVNLSVHADTARTPLIAWDPVARSERWRVDRPMPINSGVLSTGGNLVFQGLGTGEVEAYKADTGERLWSYQTEGAIAAAPITVRVAGRQLLLIYNGNGGSTMVLRGWRALWNAPVRNALPRLIAFSLDGTAELSAQVPLASFVAPGAARPAAVEVGDGAELFENNCAACHGQQVLGIRGLVPDLRRSPIPSAADLFHSIVIDGQRVSRGMPRFSFTDAELERIRAYVLQQSWASYEAQQRGTELVPDWRSEGK